MPGTLKLNSGGAGNLILTPSGSVGSDVTVTIPAATATLATVDGSGNFSVSGNLSFNSGYGSTTTAYGCRAWVNYSSYGSNLIYGSGNVSSVTDLSTGRTRINFTTAMPNTNYAVVYGVGDDQIVWNGGASLASVNNGLKTTGYTSFHVSNNTFSDTEYYEMSIAVFR